MADPISLDGVTMYVSSTASNGVVGAQTRLRFRQYGTRVLGRYEGGSIRRGCLVGRVSDERLAFRYAQVESSGEIHGGRSNCEITALASGRLRIVERFSWSTRDGSGANVFDEVPPE